MNYHNITKDDMLNGTGLRVVLWVSGCSHQCFGCQNPTTWEEQGGIPFDNSAKQELFSELEHTYINGITLSGGDPLYRENRKEIYDLILEIHTTYPNKTLWLYTGYTWDEIKDLPCIDYLDVIVDGKFEQSLHDNSLHWRGSSNQRVIDVKKTKNSHEIVLWGE